jgi:predicted transcriptional regulator
MKFIKLFPIIGLVLIIIVSSICFAEFYKYKDSNGVLRFTDNLAEVPEGQRPKADIYKEYVPEKPDTSKELQNEIQSSEEKLQDTTNNSKEIQIKVLGDKIAKIQKNLQKEYQQLIEKKKALEAMDQKAGQKDSTHIQYLNEQAAQLNKDIKTYNQKKETCLKAIMEYQKQLKLLSTTGNE